MITSQIAAPKQNRNRPVTIHATKTLLLCKSTYGIISEQVFRLVLYKAKAFHFYTLPSQFPNDRLSPTDIKTFNTYGDSSSQGSLTPFPFHRLCPLPAYPTLCVKILNFTLIVYHIKSVKSIYKLNKTI